MHTGRAVPAGRYRCNTGKQDLYYLVRKRSAIKQLLHTGLLLSLLLSGQSVRAQSRDDSAFIRHAFRTADDYMSQDQYDSAQLWLNRIHEKVSYRKPSLFSYFLTARQAEVYYYNNLQQLGMQEAQRAFTIATALGDSILLADAYNFNGLFLTNLGRIRDAIFYFKKGISYSRQTPYPARYIELSGPHHLYGNLSEAFEKLEEQDSAIFYGRLSLQEARRQRHGRGIASAGLGLGSSFLKKRLTDSAIHYFRQAQTVSKGSLDFDVEVHCNGSLARCYALQDKPRAALQLLDEGFALLRAHPQLNSFYAMQFLGQAAGIFRQYGKYRELAAALEQQSAIQEATHRKNNQQYRNLLMTGLKNETRILAMEVEEAKQGRVLATTRLYVFALLASLLVAGFLAYRYYALQRLRVADLRNKISQDLHDEVGATLSGIALYSYISREQNRQQEHEQVAQSLDIIGRNATDMVKKLSDIVWAVNPVHDSLDGLLQRLGEYAVETAAVKEIRVQVDRDGQLKASTLTMEQRKNIYLLCKEAINNAIKYSSCRQIRIATALQQGLLVICISDDGTGFEPETVAKGNGLTNMQQRASELKATLTIDSAAGRGTSVTLRCKID